MGQYVNNTLIFYLLYYCYQYVLSLLKQYCSSTKNNNLSTIQQQDKKKTIDHANRIISYTYFINLLFILIALLPIFTVQFNPRIQCRYNNLILNRRYAVINAYMYRDTTLQQYTQTLNQDQYCGFSYGNLVIKNISNLNYNKNSEQMTIGRCSNFMVSGGSCCDANSFRRFAKTYNNIINIMINNTKYPIIHYLSNIATNLQSNSCQHNKSLLPTTTASTLSALVNNHTLVFNQIVRNQQQFLNQSLCLMCVSPKQFPLFVYPAIQLPTTPVTNILRVDYLTTLLLQLESMHNSIANYIIQLANSIQSNSAVCSGIKNQAINSAFLNGKKLCFDQSSCRKIVVKYFGELGTPQIVMYINRVSNGLGMFVGAGDYYIAEDDRFGFKGNVSSYGSVYGIRYMPEVSIYKAVAQFAGLY